MVFLALPSILLGKNKKIQARVKIYVSLTQKFGRRLWKVEDQFFTSKF